MKKVMNVLISVLLLVACGDDLKGIEVNKAGMQEFYFDENDFKEVYEKNTGKAIPVSFEMDFYIMGIENATAEQVEGFLKTAYDLLGDDVILKMYNSFKKDKQELSPDENWRKVESGDRLFLDYGILENGLYMSTVHLNIESE